MACSRENFTFTFTYEKQAVNKDAHSNDVKFAVSSYSEGRTQLQIGIVARFPVAAMDSHNVHSGSGATHSMGTKGSLPWVKRPEREADHSRI